MSTCLVYCTNVRVVYLVVIGTFICGNWHMILGCPVQIVNYTFTCPVVIVTCLHCPVVIVSYMFTLPCGNCHVFTLPSGNCQLHVYIALW